MSLDRYLAICHPLHYETLMSGRVCSQLVLASWLAGFLWVLCPTILVASLPFCGPNVIDHFFCDSWPLLKLSCRNTCLLEVVAFVLSMLVLLVSLGLTCFVHLHSCHGPPDPHCCREKESVLHCASHLTVVVTVYGSSIFLYIHLSETQSLLFNKGASVLSCIVTPLLNSFIFSLCNNKMKQALGDALRLLQPTAVRKL